MRNKHDYYPTPEWCYKNLDIDSDDTLNDLLDSLD